MSNSQTEVTRCGLVSEKCMQVQTIVPFTKRRLTSIWSKAQRGAGTITRTSKIVSPTKCRIPQRIIDRSRGVKVSVTGPQVKLVHHARIPQRTPRPWSAEHRQSPPVPGTKDSSGKPNRSLQLPSVSTNRKQFNIKKAEPEKIRARIVPNSKSPPKPRKMLDQDAIKEREELELNKNENHQDDLDYECEDVIKIKSSWQDKVERFERMKAELDQRQKNIMELYATLKSNHKLMSALGQDEKMPSVDDLSIMNVAKLTPDQLLQLCADSLPQLDDQINKDKLNDMPAKLINTCELTLTKRKEIIDWFQSIKNEEKGISTKLLTKKINEFSAENEMLHSSLQTSKLEFLKNLNEIIDYLRRCVNETVAHQLCTHELQTKYAELDKENCELKKELQSRDSIKLQTNKVKLDVSRESLSKIYRNAYKSNYKRELRKELKEEKNRNAELQELLTTAEGQVKINNERAAQLESALELARSQNWAMEQAVQQLNDQNQKLQSDFDKELSKLTQSIRDNTRHLEGIAQDREKLLAEKESLEKRLEELSSNYTKSLDNVRKELNTTMDKLAKAQQQLQNESEIRDSMEAQLKNVCGELFGAELRYKDMLEQLKEKDNKISQLAKQQNELEETKQKLEEAKAEIIILRTRLDDQDETIKQIEVNLKETVNAEKNLRLDLRNKEKHAAELEKKVSLLEQVIHESEHKIDSYETQIETLRSYADEIQQEFGKFNNLHQLREMLCQQRNASNELSNHNEELAKNLKEKEFEVESHMNRLGQLESQLEQKEGIIRILSEKEEEQSNIIKLLRNNLEMRAQADADLSQQLIDKNAEINSLITNLDTRKQQISQLEKIILTLEEQIRKVHYQRRRDQEKMAKLEKSIQEYASQPLAAKKSVEVPVENLDNLIKILEDELGTSFDPLDKRFKTKPLCENKINHDYPTEGFEYSHNRAERERISKKFMEDYPKKNMFMQECLDRKRALTKMETPKWIPNIEPINVYTASADKDHSLAMRDMPGMVQLMMNQREDKKCKMFKFAGHKL